MTKAKKKIKIHDLVPEATKRVKILDTMVNALNAAVKDAREMGFCIHLSCSDEEYFINPSIDFDEEG